MNRYFSIFKKEMLDLLRSRSFLALTVILSALIGYSFIQAVNLFSEASRAALTSPGLAVGMVPLDGVLVPTFGSYYLVLTLLYPFVAIRIIGTERQSGSMKLFLQLPSCRTTLFGFKTLALAMAWIIILLPGLLSLLLWHRAGGHMHGPETLNLLIGHSLYAWAVTGLALLAAGLSPSLSTAAIVALALTTGSWVLDFSSGASGSLLSGISFLSLSAALRPFERGLFLSNRAMQLFLIGLGGFISSVILLTPSHKWRQWRNLSIAISVMVLIGFLATRFSFSWDVSENRRNSFSRADEGALKSMKAPLHITIYLSHEDSRLKDFEVNILDKLRRTVPDLRVSYAKENSGRGLDSYGMIAYEYAGKKDESTSNSDEEILPLLHRLAGQSIVTEPQTDYPGYPLTTYIGGSGIWFYGVLPAVFLLGAWIIRRRPCLN